jgi:hypothetical protein
MEYIIFSIFKYMSSICEMLLNFMFCCFTKKSEIQIYVIKLYDEDEENQL